jgi:hypothetical protein
MAIVEVVPLLVQSVLGEGGVVPSSESSVVIADGIEVVVDGAV